MTRVNRTGALMTAEELFELPNDEDKRSELVNGVLRVSEPTGWQHGRLATRLMLRLAAVVEPAQLGGLVPEVGFVLRRKPDVVRAPDVAFLRTERFPPAAVAHRFFEGAPDLAVEVLSPDDRAWEVAEKVDDYLSAGTRLVWVVDPRHEHVVVHTPDGAARTLRAADSLDGADVIPGFRWTTAELFAGRA